MKSLSGVYRKLSAILISMSMTVIISVMVILTGCSQPISSSSQSVIRERVIQSVRTERMFPWEAEFVIAAQEEYRTMDLLVYRLEEGEWEKAEYWQDIPLSENGDYEDSLSFNHDKDAFEIDFNNKDTRIRYTAAFDRKEEGYANGYAWIAHPQILSEEAEIPIYGLVRSQGNAIKAFTVEDFNDQKEYEEGIVFAVRFSK